MKEIAENIRSRSFHRAYLLYGPEHYLRDMYLKKLLEALVSEGDEINFARFSGKGVEESAVISQAETLPFFSERRVILVEDSGFFKNKADAITDYLAELPEYLVLVFSEEEVDKRTRSYKALRKAGYAAEFSVQSEESLSRWVLTKMKGAGKKITPADMHRFLDAAGTDMANIDNELEKLLAYCGDREVITAEDIAAICAPQMTNQIFEMVRAVADHRRQEALDLYYDLLALKEKPMRILYLISRQYNQLLLMGTMSRAGLPQGEIASRAGVPPFVVKKSMGLLRQYSEEQLRQILEELAGAEERVKTGRLDERMSVELAIVKLSS